MALWTKSIRVRLTFGYTLLLFSTLLAFGAVSYYYTGRTLSENLDISLRNEVRWVRDFIQPQAYKIKPGRRSLDNLLEKRVREPSTALKPTDVDTLTEEADEIWNQIFRHTLHTPKKTYIQFADRRGNVLYRSYNLATDTLVMADTIPQNSITVTTGYLNGEPIRLAATRDKSYSYLVGYPQAEVRDLLDSLYFIFLLMVPVAVAVSVFGGLALADRALAPVHQITTRARRITAENLDQTIAVKNEKDEIGQLTATINDMIRRLHDSFAQVRQFSADASHELRTPLTVMRGEMELCLRNPKTPDQYRRVLESSLEEILRMSKIIDNLLELARADRGTGDVTFSEVDLKALVDELFEDSVVLAEQKEICIELKEASAITIVGDRVRLRQLFLNLVDNAIKYTPERGHVWMSIRREDGTAVFEVQDTGMGIPAAEQEKVFNRFYRVDKARSRERGGTGLGLSIAKWIAELHRGSISVQSELGKGSTFTVKLPLT
ncbi:MAG TPA: ATP-binding protein [Bacteroidota bacterium]